MSAEMDIRIERPRRTRPLIIAAGTVALLVLAVAGGLAWRGGVRSSQRVAAAGLTIEVVTAGVFHDFAVLRATAAPRDVVYLDALEGGRVEQVLAQAGDAVAAGQPLVRFRNTQLELDVLDREGRLVESITQLQAYEKQLEDSALANARAAADTDYNITRLSRSAARREALAAKGYLAPEARDQVRDELDYYQRLRPLQAASTRRQDALRQDQLPQIRTELAALRQSLTITRAKLDDLVVRAPVAGRLTDMDLYVGQIRNRGERLGQIVSGSDFKLTAQIDEYYLDRVRVGQSASVEAPGTGGGNRFALRVARVNPTVKDATFQVELTFVGAAPQGLLPGQALEGRLALGGDRPALILPAGAFLERTGGDWVMVVGAAGTRAERRRVRLGRRNAAQVEVLEGLKPGERVITSDYTGFDKVDRLDLKP
jgi:HlyD family secretion protein